MPGNEPSTEGTGGSPALRVGGGPPAAKPSLLHPKAAATSGMGDLWKVPWSPRLLVVGIPIPASFLGVNPTTDDITLCRVELQELACVREIKVKGEEIKRHNTPWLFVTSAPLLLKWTIQEQGFPPGSGYLSNQLGRKKCCRLVAISQNNNFKTKGFPGGSEVKASACNAGDSGLIPESGRSPGEGNGNPL